MVKSVICIIPARGGSKRLPKKNILKYRGIPLVELACRTALEAELFDEVIVSSEDAEIQSIVKKIEGVQIHPRPRYLADDNTRADEVVRNVIEFKGLSSNSDICCLLPTTPKITFVDLQKAYKAFCSNISITPLFAVIASAQTPFRSFITNENSSLTPLFPERLLQQSQDYPLCVHDAGQFYFANVEHWKDNYSITASPGARGYLLERFDILDINTPKDWEIFLALDQNTTVSEGEEVR